MNYMKISIRFLLFTLLLLLATLIVEFIISNVYALLLEYYSLPKSDSNITFLSFVISLVFTSLLTYGTGFWHVSRVSD
ncbi:hypothetical protein JCM21142_1688 [Saccharicrinis fermentans DSM 9555 = JCM 21142]|uniref:Uncharacterized protein n=1 Tax=Saccharicrinis fermentans DSM 9555 = JCM 21142 TaxID=869213 RepID=W7Y296_9BACT|nr:hypothetical protein JCM21142_1688 [Saccharicrinis fermentans DSM 9555 = JCM 21142]